MVKRLRKLKKNIRLHSEGTSTLIWGAIALALLCLFFGYAKRASAIMDEYSDAVQRSGETAAETAERIAALEDEIESLSDQSKWEEGGQAEAAQKLVDKKRELAEVQKLYLERVNAAAEAEYARASAGETARKYQVEQELNEARKTGIKHIIAFKEAELAHVADLAKSVEIQKKYYADHRYLVESEEDRIHIMADAEKYAAAAMDNLREERRQAAQKADTETWLNAQIESSRQKQRGLEFDILRARWRDGCRRSTRSRPRSGRD